MDWIVFPLRDGLVWTFDNVMEPTGNILNYTWIGLGFIGLFIWLNMQAKYNADAKANPDQIK